MKKIALLLLVVFFAISCIAQQNQGKKRISQRKLKKTITYKQINELKSGVLLVRLHTKANTILALRANNYMQQANQLELKQKELNLKIVSAFNCKFNFCPVFFFYSDNSKKLQDKEFDKVVLLNDGLQPDTNITFPSALFYIAEFGSIEQDSAKYFTHNSYVYDENWTMKKEANYRGGPNMGFSALIVKNNKFMQLKRPFPYYVRLFNSLPIQRKPAKAVAKLNKKLNSFYKVANSIK